MSVNRYRYSWSELGNPAKPQEVRIDGMDAVIEQEDIRNAKKLGGDPICTFEKIGVMTHPRHKLVLCEMG